MPDRVTLRSAWGRRPGGRSGQRFQWRSLSGRRLAGTGVLAVLVICAALWPGLAPAALSTSDYLSADRPPSPAHPMGTDGLGRDLTVLVAEALRVSLTVAAAAALLAGLIGVLVGSTAAAGGGRVDAALMRTTDAVAAVPHLLATVVVVAMFRGSLPALVLALALTHWAGVARVVRAEAQQVMASRFVAVSRAAGASPAQLARQHLFPAVAGQAGIAVVLMVPHAVWHESTLSFLGIGMPPERPSLGTLIALSQTKVLIGHWRALLFPTVALIAVTAAVALLAPVTGRRFGVGGRAGRAARVHAPPPRGRGTGRPHLTASFTSPGAAGAGLVIESLTVSHPTNGQLVTAVRDVSLQVQPGQILALVGPSGAGKSTILDACAGVLPAAAEVSGQIYVPSGGSVGHVPQAAANAFTPTRHVRGQLAEGLVLRRRSTAAVAPGEVTRVDDDIALSVNKLCRLVGIEPTLADRYPHQLSGGQLRRMAVAAAASTGPTVLVADEPTSGLDPERAQAILELLRALAVEAGMAVVVVTHDLPALANVVPAIEMVQIRGGRVVGGERTDPGLDPKGCHEGTGEHITPDRRPGGRTPETVEVL